LVAEGRSLTRAYAEAGYADDHRNASTLRQNTTVGERIKELTDQAAERAGVSIERVLKELTKIAFANMGDYVSKDGIVDPSTLSPDQLAALGEVDLTRAKVKLLDKRAALVDLGRHLGMFVDKTETKDTTPIMVSPVAGEV